MTCHILVVEDSATQAEALRALLEEAGYTVTVARSGEEALEQVARLEFDLILSDIMMPGISGYELCRRLKTDPRWRGVPVVLLTSLGDPMDIVRGLEAGADNYITKPYEPEHLLARIRHVLDNRRLRRTARTSMGVSVNFLGTELNITSDKEQILDLLLSSVEDVIRTNRALEESRRELADAHAQLEAYAREKAREARVSTERYRSLMQNAGDAIFVLDTRGRIVEANRRAEELLGRPLREVVGRPLEDFVVAGQEEAVRESLAEVAEVDRLEKVERSLRHADGSVVSCEVSASLTRVGEEELVLAIYRDITERKRSEEVLRRREAQLAEAQKIARVGSWEYDLRTDALTGSEQGYRILGLDPEMGELTFEEFLERVHPEDREQVLAANEAALREHVLISEEYRAVWDDGTERMVHARGEAELGPDGTPRLLRGTVQDVTEQRILEAQLRQSQKMEAVGRLAGGIAHDFNNILTVIRGNTQLMLLDIPEEDPLREETEEIIRSVDRAASLTHQLLTFSRKEVVEPRVVSLNAVVTDAEKLLRRVLGEDIEFITRLDPALGAVRADPGQLEQVLLNLGVNARDAMPKGGKLILETRDVELEGEYVREHVDVEPGSYVLLAVSDTGHGMSRAVQERAFEPFFTTKPKGEGTGLGLSTVYGIVQQNGGHIEIESEVGQGTTFEIYLPRVADLPSAEEPGHAPAEQEEQSGTILLVEDEPAVRNVVRKALERRGYLVIAVESGAEALRLSTEREVPVDLLMTDVIMPRMNGRELAERMAAEHPGLRVLYMSGYTDEIVSRRGMLDPGVELIQKPFSPDALARKVSTVLSRSAER